MFAIGRETNNVYDGLIWRKTRIVNRVEGKRRFTLENPATREKKKKKKRDSIVCQPFPSRSMLFTRVVIPRQCGVI